MAKWSFTMGPDNGGGRHCYTITAPDKQQAIAKGFEKARSKSKGDLSPHWECRLIKA